MIPLFRHSEDGSQVYLNQVTRYVKSNFLVPPQAQNPLTIPAAAAANSPTFGTPIIFEADEGSVAEVRQLMYEDSSAAADVTDRLSVEITDTAWRRRYMNRPCLASHVFGSSLQPFQLQSTIFLEGQQTLVLQFINNSTVGQAQVRTAMETRKFQLANLNWDSVTRKIEEERRKKRYLTPYWQTSDAPINLPASGSVDVFFTSTRDIIFIAFGVIASWITTGVAGNTQEGFEFSAFDPKTERPLFNRPLTSNTGTGTAQFPFYLPEPLIWEPNVKQRIQFTNLVTDAATEVFFTYFGVACYVGQSPYRDEVDAPQAGMKMWGAP